jgi:hypothetical protein
MRLTMVGSLNPGVPRKTFPRGKPGSPTKVPFGAMTINCSTQLCADANGAEAINPMRALLRIDLIGMASLEDSQGSLD